MTSDISLKRRIINYFPEGFDRNGVFMNRRSFIKGVFGTVLGLSILPFIPDDPISILRHRGKVRYKGINWIFSDSYGFPGMAKQLYGSTEFNGRRYDVGFLIDNYDAEDDKKVLYFMDCITRRFKFRRDQNEQA